MNDPVLLCLVDESLSDHVLQLLRDGGVTGQLAHVQRRDSDGNPLRPQDQTDKLGVVVTQEEADQARSVLELVLPQLFEQRPGSGHLSDRLVRSDDPGPDSGPVMPLPVWRGPQESMLEDDDLLDDEDFDRPEPPPIEMPRDLVNLLAWLAVIAGPVLFLITVLLSWGGEMVTLAVVLFFGGFGTLIWRHGEGSRRDDDNGAVV